jgi:hypothetical protein
MTSRVVLETIYGKIIRATPQASGTTLFCRLPYTKKPSPIDPNSNPQRRDDVSKERLTVKLSCRPGASDGRRRHAEVPAADHLRLRCTMKAARMMMKTAMKVAERMCYPTTLAAPNHQRVTACSSDC